MEIVQDGCGTTHLKMYDKRDSMTTLALYRKFPHIETKLSARCKYAVLHSQLCRFASRCTRIVYFEVAAAKLMTAMLDHFYDPTQLYHKLHNFRVVFFRKTPIFVPNSHREDVCIGFWFRVEREVQRRIINRAFDCSCVPKVCVACLKRTERMCWTYGSTNSDGIR